MACWKVHVMRIQDLQSLSRWWHLMAQYVKKGSQIIDIILNEHIKEYTQHNHRRQPLQKIDLHQP
jgi:hypothetical protein